MNRDFSKINKRLAELEFVNDQLFAELQYIDQLLYSVGFPKGLKTIKDVAHEVLAEDEFPESC
ncbi:hypothetical protein [Chlamydiifrater phoenicopteri]|uniref:hypothetical protein n=1 Tax=Chlamydiifrater phoenicopteri TaxID=2681469 RepID=UPI001BCDF76E|nr:hypothetical protein [Chlamydiifrater phoenicopteri]